MEILCVIDSLEGIDKKIKLLEPFGADIKFFVSVKHVAKLARKKSIIKNIIAIYSDNVNQTIDKYLKSSTYIAQATLLYYTSADLNVEIIDNIRENLKLSPDTIYIKKTLSKWDKFKLWFYQKIIKVLFGSNDAYASVKLQYFSKELMVALKQTKFNNHIFEIESSVAIELEKGKEQSYYNKPKLNKNLLYNPIVFCLILICYVVLERFLSLPFWVYFLVIALLLLTIINLIVMIVKSTFDIRYKK